MADKDNSRDDGTDPSSPNVAATKSTSRFDDAASRMPLGDHLEELRGCLIRSLVGVGVATFISLLFAKRIIGFLCQPLFAVQEIYGLPSQLQALAPQSGFTAYLKVGFLVGLIGAMPWVLLQIWSFVATGLYPREQKIAKRFIPVSIGLFGIGVAFLYWVVLPIVLNFFVLFNESFSEYHTGPSAIQKFILGDGDKAKAPGSDEGQPADPGGGSDSTILPLPTVPRLDKRPSNAADGSFWFDTATGRLMLQVDGAVRSVRLDKTVRQSSINSQFAIDFYVSFTLLLMLAFGLAFELPIVVWFVSRVGIISADEMGKNRKYVILGLAVIAAVLTPPEVISQIMLAVPMYGLFEIGLLVARISEKRNR